MNNESIQNTILAALRAALFQGPLPTVSDSFDWDTLLQEAQQQAILPIVYGVLEALLPEEVRQKWNSRLYSAIANNVRVISAHASLHRLLTDHGFPYVILKGCAAARFYPDPLRRMMGDVDFYVPPKLRETCAALLADTGFSEISKFGSHPYHTEYTYQQVTYELHWDAPGIPAVGGEPIHAHLQNLLDTAVLVHGIMGDYYVPDHFHHGLILLLHTASHLTSGGVGLRHLCDWAVFIDQISDSEVLEQYKASLAECGLWEFARILTTLAARYLGSAKRPWADIEDDDLLFALMKDIWEGGNFGRKDQQRHDFGYIGRDFGTRQVKERGFLAKLGMGLQDRAAMRFPRLARHKLLLPLAWMAVLVRYGYRVVTGRSTPMNLRKEADMLRARGSILQKLKLFETQ